MHLQVFNFLVVNTRLFFCFCRFWLGSGYGCLVFLYVSPFFSCRSSDPCWPGKVMLNWSRRQRWVISWSRLKVMLAQGSWCLECFNAGMGRDLELTTVAGYCHIWTCWKGYKYCHRYDHHGSHCSSWYPQVIRYDRLRWSNSKLLTTMLQCLWNKASTEESPSVCVHLGDLVTKNNRCSRESSFGG